MAIVLEINRAYVTTEAEPTWTDTIVDTVKSIALGILATLAISPIINYLTEKSFELMQQWGFDFSSAQEAVQILLALEPGVLKVAFIGYVIFLGPLIEEYLFRGLLYPLMQEWIGDPDSYLSKALCVLGNGLLFGAMHLSPFQGWTNLPVFLATFLLGCLFAALREYTGNITASTTSHILHNAAAINPLI